MPETTDIVDSQLQHTDEFGENESRVRIQKADVSTALGRYALLFNAQIARFWL